MNGEPSNGWYAFHFGSQLAKSAEFRPDRWLQGGEHDCWVLLADFCSFTSFMRSTENVKLVEPILTSFYSESRKAIHRHSGMLYQIVGDSVAAVWGLHSSSETAVGSILGATKELTAIARRVAEEWQSHIDLLVEPKGLRLGLSRGAVRIIPRDGVYPGLLLFGNPINLASRLQSAASPNELVCSNCAYNAIHSSGVNLPFEPYRGESGSTALDARNYGALKAWVLPVDQLDCKGTPARLL